MGIKEFLEEVEEVKKEIDLRGEVCPYTFLITKLVLEELKQGEILKVVVDYPPAVENIPRSIKQQRIGETLSIQHDEDETFVLTIRKT